MYKKLTAAAVIIALAVATMMSHAPLVSAHVLKQDNGVTAVMHIAPFDDPSAGEPTRIEFEYGSDARDFSLNDYQVSVQVTTAGKVIAQKVVTPAYFGSAAQGAVDVTFPTIGVYNLKLQGKPTTATAPTFQMNYDIRVAKAVGEVTNKADGTIPLVVSATVLLVFGMVAIQQIIRGGRYDAKTEQ